jgi:hypothetical protein
MVWKPVWNERCSEVLRRNAQHYTNSEIAAAIEAATGLRFSVPFVSRRRAALGLDCPQRNDWSAPITRRRWLRSRSVGTKPARQQRETP